MASREYRIAQRRGQAQYEADIAKGVYPYLQVLEELTQNIEIIKEVSLGVVDIPLSQVVGTNGHNRSTSFARNFLPIMKEETEFAAKWSALADIHVQEGIRDPIKCYEFMNRFYVVEGNKRVSVLKYFDAVEIPADVTRIIPRPDGSLASRLYQEFMKFYKVSRINYLNFTEPSFYGLLLEYLGKQNDEKWNEEYRRKFKSYYYQFVQAFVKSGGRKLDITESDAFLEFLKIFPFEEIGDWTDKEIQANISKIWTNLSLAAQEMPIGLHMQPEEEKKKNIAQVIAGGISDVFGGNKGPLKIAFVYGKTPKSSGWTYGHDLGRRHVEEAMKDEVKIRVVENALQNDKTPDEILKELAEESDVIFTATPQLCQETIRAAVENPKVKFLNCSVNQAAGQIRTYYGRMYEAKFLAGLIAGTMTENDRIVYVADYPIPGMTAGVNGFARGVQLTNPRAKVYLFWSSVAGEDIEREIEKADPDIVCHQDFITPSREIRHYGLYMRKNGVEKHLAMPLWNWGLFYEKIVRSIASGAWYESDEEEETHSINYWWGLSSGVVDIVLSDDVPEGVKQLVWFYTKAIRRRVYSPFDGYIRDQKGGMRSEEDGYISTRHIVTMDWLMDNVIGEIPAFEDLRSDAQDLIKEIGLSEKGSDEMETISDKVPELSSADLS